MTLLVDVVGVSDQVAATRSRSAKVALLAELLRRLDDDEVPICVGFLSGVPRQGRVGIGYSIVYGTEPQPARAPTLTVGDVDRVICEIQVTVGAGSATVRQRLLGDLFR